MKEEEVRTKKYVPAEWEPHSATILCWPHQKNDWPGKFNAIPWVFVEIIKQIIPAEKILLIVQDEIQQTKVGRILQRTGVDLKEIEFVLQQTDRGWMRDTAPFFIKKQGAVHSLGFQFNGWAKYNNWQLDQIIPGAISKRLNMAIKDVLYNGHKVVLEGGAIDTNGHGTLITTEACLLDPKVQVRNPGFTKENYEALFKTFLGVTNVIWLADGIQGDDTHGHVDDLCRFVNHNTVVLCSESNRKDANYEILKENAGRLKKAKLEDGSAIQVVYLPMPSPVIFDGVRLPASYANFYICNQAVLVPTFNDPNDRIALNILSELFPKRKVVGIHSVDLVWGFGAIHCLSHEVPV